MQLKDFLPPILIKLIKRSKQNHKLFDSYEEALCACACKSGYEENDIVSVVYEKTKIYRDSISTQHPLISEITSLRTLIGLSLATRKHEQELNVIDFGGACGTHYFLAKALLGKKVNLRWHVVETTKMVSKAIGMEDGKLAFFDDLQKAKSKFNHVDIVFTSGALQYVPKPYEFLKQLTECRADNIFITRVGLSTCSNELVIIQKSTLSANSPGAMPHGIVDRIVEYPVIFSRKDKFEEILNQNYSIKILFNEDKCAYQAANHSIDMYGYLAELKKEA